MNYLLRQTTQCQLLACLLLAVSGTALAENDKPIMPFATANDLMTVVGKLRLSSAQLEDSLHYCSGKFVHLQESAHSARQQWQQRNQAVLAQAARVNAAVIDSVRQNASAFVAEKMALEMEALVTKSVRQFSIDFAAKSAKEQHYLCNRLILSIAAGERDLEQQNPDDTQRLLEFK